MAKLEFNQQNVDRKITEIKGKSENERKAIADEIKANIRAWLLQNFEFSADYQTRLALWPASMREETGFGIATALLYPDWNLRIILPNNPAPERGRKTEHEQTVSGEYDPINGGYTVTKSHTWKW